MFLDSSELNNWFDKNSKFVIIFVKVVFFFYNCMMVIMFLDFLFLVHFSCLYSFILNNLLDN